MNTHMIISPDAYKHMRTCKGLNTPDYTIITWLLTSLGFFPLLLSPMEEVLEEEAFDADMSTSNNEEQLNQLQTYFDLDS